MHTVTKIACRTIGTLGMGVALYNAGRVAGHQAKVEAGFQKANQMERAYFDARTIDNHSYFSNGVRKKTFELRSKNPLPKVFGNIKGAITGFLSSMGTQLFTIGCSAMALLSKGLLAKIGAAGVGLAFIYEVARNGLGIGKHNPMN